MAVGTVRVRGLNELIRDFRKLDKQLAKDLQKEIKEAAQIVQVDARERFAGIDAKTAAGFRPRVRGASGFVQQRLGKTTGQHPEFGAFQMRRALVPALGAKSDEVVRRMDQMLGKLAGEF